ncbi:unnamed protein product [Candidula unifasciata]|uniref:Adenylyltransferase and sulfurtransferase MOCS3 homolog n=1 Tax=Candidula unifasciata TaxID=100452 RepID=A0A8S3ZVC1_9EUPU|nr:unnamed protein product [Candidula unifasciata]
MDVTVKELQSELAEKEEEIRRLKQLLNMREDQEERLKVYISPEVDVGDKTYHERLSNADISRYSRQLILPEFGVTGQIKLKSSSVLVVGAGGLGCPAAIYLAAAGVGKLGVVDYDEVELSNLHRQILHTVDRVGVSKSLSVAQSCFRLNPSVLYIPYQLQLNSTNALDIIKSYDVVVDATDNVATRYLLNDACVLANKPLVSGSALRFEGQPPPPETVTNCSEGGVLGVVPGIIGSLQALEAIKIASGMEPSFCQRLLLFDGLDGTFRNIKLRSRSKSCSVCGEKPTILKLIDYEQFCGAGATDKNPDLHVLSDSSRISAKEYASMLNDRVPHVLLDVRPAVELDICKLPHPALNIPFPLFNKNISQVASQIMQVVNDQCHSTTEQPDGSTIQVVCVCRRGNDSQLAVDLLQKKLLSTGVNLVDIRGGLYSWTKQVDADFPTY